MPPPSHLTLSPKKHYERGPSLLRFLLLPKGSCCISGSRDVHLIAIYYSAKCTAKKSRTAISRGSLPARHKSAKLFLLRKLSTCGPRPCAPEMQACHSAYRVIKPSSGGGERGHEVPKVAAHVAACRGIPRWDVICVFHCACQPPASRPRWMSCGPSHVLDSLTLSCKTKCCCLPVVVSPLQLIILEDYADPFDAEQVGGTQTTTEKVTTENDGYMEPYEAQKMMAGR